MASWAVSIVHPIAPVGAVFFIIPIRRDRRAAKEAFRLASRGHEEDRIARFQATFHTSLVAGGPEPSQPLPQVLSANPHTGPNGFRHVKLALHFVL